jgi:hypothetical protein
MLRTLNTSTRLALAALLLSAGAAQAHGGATCDAGPKEKWQSQELLQKQLTDKGWQVRRVRIDGGCYEVYAVDDKGQRLEAYFHPLTLERVPSRQH